MRQETPREAFTIGRPMSASSEHPRLERRRAARLRERRRSVRGVNHPSLASWVIVSPFAYRFLGLS